jgi:hypothetical protein
VLESRTSTRSMCASRRRIRPDRLARLRLLSRSTRLRRRPIGLGRLSSLLRRLRLLGRTPSRRSRPRFSDLLRFLIPGRIVPTRRGRSFREFRLRLCFGFCFGLRCRSGRRPFGCRRCGRSRLRRRLGTDGGLLRWRLVTLDEVRRYARLCARHAIGKHRLAVAGQFLLAAEHIRVDHFRRIKLANWRAAGQHQHDRRGRSGTKQQWNASPQHPLSPYRWPR